MEREGEFNPDVPPSEREIFHISTDDNTGRIRGMRIDEALYCGDWEKGRHAKEIMNEVKLASYKNG
jgi:hypothetical protein